MGISTDILIVLVLYQSTMELVSKKYLPPVPFGYMVVGLVVLLGLLRSSSPILRRSLIQDVLRAGLSLVTLIIFSAEAYYRGPKVFEAYLLGAGLLLGAYLFLRIIPGIRVFFR